MASEETKINPTATPLPRLESDDDATRAWADTLVSTLEGELDEIRRAVTAIAEELP